LVAARGSEAGCNVQQRWHARAALSIGELHIVAWVGGQEDARNATRGRPS